MTEAQASSCRDTGFATIGFDKLMVYQMIKNKQLIVWKLQKKVDSYFNNKKRLAKHDIYQSACRTVIWLMVEKSYTITSACKYVSRKQGIRPGTISNILSKYILSKEHLERHRKICQSKFFKKLELGYDEK